MFSDFYRKGKRIKDLNQRALAEGLGLSGAEWRAVTSWLARMLSVSDERHVDWLLAQACCSNNDTLAAIAKTAAARCRKTIQPITAAAARHGRLPKYADHIPQRSALKIVEVAAGWTGWLEYQEMAAIVLTLEAEHPKWFKQTANRKQPPARKLTRAERLDAPKAPADYILEGALPAHSATTTMAMRLADSYGASETTTIAVTYPQPDGAAQAAKRAAAYNVPHLMPGFVGLAVDGFAYQIRQALADTDGGYWWFARALNGRQARYQARSAARRRQYAANPAMRDAGERIARAVALLAADTTRYADVLDGLTADCNATGYDGLEAWLVDNSDMLDFRRLLTRKGAVIYRQGEPIFFATSDGAAQRVLAALYEAALQAARAAAAEPPADNSDLY